MPDEHKSSAGPAGRAAVMIRVMVVDDHTLFRQGVRALLSGLGDVEVVGEAGDGREAVALARELVPDVVLMDLAMPVLNGVEATRQIRKALPEVKVVALTMHADERYVFQALKAGASGYLLKSCTSGELEGALRSVAAGSPYFSPAISRKIMERYLEEEEGKKRPAGPDPLTSREREALQLIAEGYTNAQVAGLMGISVKTVETHRSHIMAKIGVHDVTGLIKYAINKGIIVVET